MTILRVLSLAFMLVGPRTAHAQRLPDSTAATAVPAASADSAPRDTSAAASMARAGAAVTRADTAVRPVARSRRGLHARRGAVIGATLGAGVALFMANQLQESPGENPLGKRETWAAIGALGAAGALVGALAGALIP